MRKLAILGACAVMASSLILLANNGSAQASGCENLEGRYAFRLTSLKSFSADDPAQGGVLGAPYQDILRVGILRINANCSLTADLRATIDNNAGATRLVVFTWTGTALPSTTAGLGELRVQPGPQTCHDSTLFTFAGGKPVTACPPDIEGDEEYEYVTTRDGLELIQSDNRGGGAKIFLTGTAQRLGGKDKARGNDKDEDEDDD